jgi:phage tail P2-like protein
MTDLLPRNATPQERAIASTVARLSDVPTPIRDIWSPQTCPNDLLPWLAWALSVDEWNPDWTDLAKRNVIASSVEVHRKKGTIGAVRTVLANFGITPESIVEWWQTSPQGTPHTFTIRGSFAATPAEQQSSIVAAVNAVKPVRSEFNFEVSSTGGFLSQVNVLTFVRPAIFNRYSTTLTY